MYSVNEMILYGSQGICRIDRIEELDFTGTRKQYYVLKPVRDQKATVYVCVTNEKAVEQMRQVMTADEIREMVRELPDTPESWIENKNERNESYKQILQSGDRSRIACMLRTLSTHRRVLKEAGKKMHLTDEKFFRDAEKMLCEEFSIVLNISEEDVLPLIMGDAEKE